MNTRFRQQSDNNIKTLKCPNQSITR